eukprot:2883133-Amphidinium_carterae.1
MEFDSNDVAPDADARPSTWTAPSMFPVEAEEPRLDEQIGTESDVDVDSPPWICTFNEEGRRFVSWGHKVCGVCGEKRGDLRRCTQCHHHIHCRSMDCPVRDCFSSLPGTGLFVCALCRYQITDALRDQNTSSGEEVERRESVPEGVDPGPQNVSELRGE